MRIMIGVNRLVYALPHLGLGLADMLLLEQELSVQIGHVDGVEVDLCEANIKRQT